MQQLISKEQLWEKIDQLNPTLQQIVVRFIDSLLKTQTTVNKRDRSSLLKVSVWSEEDIQRIEEAQDRINA
jgi:flagellar biosynthesis regulator FlaF